MDNNKSEEVKKLREKLQLTQKEFSAKLSIKPSYLCDIENNRRPTTYKFLNKVAETLNLSENWYKDVENIKIVNANKPTKENWCYCPHCGKSLK